MNIVLDTFHTCFVCGYRMRGHLFPMKKVRINKNSIRWDMALGMAPGPCNECGSRARPAEYLIGLDAESAQKVDAYRRRKFRRISQAQGVNR